eukprot:TRINITY_DN7259_c0_g1_i2.p1 TRINITY_DN7259_c0_g1~~TRINITY_DN7259_c0_g1_i2.p1  ORF type:complete len:140 (-),score=26.84 TRINITY_DN7259_c0_g1_i2:699-1118(-)
MVALHLVIIDTLIVYYCRRLMRALNDLPRAQRASLDLHERVKHYWHFVAMMCAGLSIIAVLFTIESINMIKRDVPFYDPVQICTFSFNMLAFVRNCVMTVATIWAWKKAVNYQITGEPAAGAPLFRLSEERKMVVVVPN